MVSRFQVYLVGLDHAIGKEAKNTRPCVVVSPDEMNRNMSSVLVAPISASTVKYPTRVEVDFLNSKRLVVLDQVRSVDKARLVKLIGEIDGSQRPEILNCLGEMFAP